MGRALYIGSDASLYVARGYSIFCSSDRGATWRVDCRIPSRPHKRLLSAHRLASRLFRQYVGGFAVSTRGVRYAIARDGIYRAFRGDLQMRRVFSVSRGSRPLNFTLDPKDRLVFGEYGRNPERHEIMVYISEDEGRTFDVAFTFAAGSIRHVHNVLYDHDLGKYWVFVGDYNHEPGIGLFDADFSHLEWLLRGGQDARVVSAIVEDDALLYGTDTEIDQNFIKRLSKKTGTARTLATVAGSSLFATKFGSIRVISTCVEPSDVNTSKAAVLYASSDGEYWEAVQIDSKDRWHPILQFGTHVLPRSDCRSSWGMFSGQALAGRDGKVSVIAFDL